ncbi:MAG: MarR family protein [Syntrophaceae bacterium PtaB.Bin095]|nr:MAG: MarR family protein [Syntrophaceae bacterium PtaB.Bin095]
MTMETKEELIKSAIQQLLRIARKYSRIEGLPVPVDGDIKITTAEAHTIQAVGEGEQVRVLDLATRFGITKSAASQMVAKLIRKGFLEKRQSPHNSKEFPLSLTALGWRAFHSHEQFHGKDWAELLERLSAFSLSQIATISVLLEAIGSVMDERLSEKEWQ